MYGIHTSSRRIDSPLAGIFKPLALAVLLSLTACAGGDIVFEGGSQASKTLDENSSGVIWTARVQVKGALDSKDLVFSLSGEDAALFTLNPTTGALSFKTSPDFEAPLDADKNNDYRLVITAAAKDKTAMQQISLKINNVTKPVVELIKPKPYENVGEGEPVEVETLVKFFDAESNSPVSNGRVELNSVQMEPSEEDAQVWRGKTTVPEGGVDLNISGSSSNAEMIKLQGRLLNKRYSTSVSHLWAIQNDFMMASGSGIKGITYFYKPMQEMIEYAPDIRLGFPGAGNKCLVLPLVCYGLGARWSDNKKELIFIPIVYWFESPSTPRFSLSLNTSSTILLEDSLDVAVDNENRRLVLLSKSGDQYIFSETRLDDKGKPNGLKPSLLFSLPYRNVASGYKQFDVHGYSKTYIFSVEQLVEGVLHSYMVGFDERGVQRFEAELGIDSSNFVVHEKAGVIYWAEHSTKSDAKIKAMNIATGVVSDLLDEQYVLAHGSFAGLGLDQKNDRLYIGDSVSNSIYMIDLTDKSMREIPYFYGHFSPPPGIED
ncbi:MAG: cadherin repeat domain-containing protein [Marinagarivorans sp.]